MNRRLLFVMRRAPYGSIMAREALDALLATAVFGQDVGVLFMDDGVFQLLDDQRGEALKQKTLSAGLAALPLYDIERLYVHRPSLEERGLSLDDLSLPELQPVDHQEVSELFSEHDQLVSF